jgi:predicted O-methyltransferase YrrM
VSDPRLTPEGWYYPGHGLHLDLVSATYNMSDEYGRRHRTQETRDLIGRALKALHEPRFITAEHTAEFIEALITMPDARQILEVGMYSGFTTLHMIRAICGKDGAKVVSIDARPAHDPEFFARPEIAEWFEFVEGWTPGAITNLKPRLFDVVFIDSDHSLGHTQAELSAVMEVTHPGSFILFHDCPDGSDMKSWIESLGGTVFPTAIQQDGGRPNLGLIKRK